MRSMGEGHKRVLLTFWRGDTLNMPVHRLRRSRCCSARPTAPPYWGGIIQAGAYDVCLARSTGAIGPSLRWGDGNFGGGCVDPEIDIYRRFVNLLRLRVFSSQLIGIFRIMFRSKVKADAVQGYFGDDAPATGILTYMCSILWG